MFAMHGPSAVECDINQLRAFLDDKVRQHELLFSGGKYKLPKNWTDISLGSRNEETRMNRILLMMMLYFFP